MKKIFFMLGLLIFSSCGTGSVADRDDYDDRRDDRRNDRRDDRRRDDDRDDDDRRWWWRLGS